MDPPFPALSHLSLTEPLVTDRTTGRNTMTAYVLSEVEILDPQSVGRYKQEAPASIAQYGGTYLARDATPTTFEGAFDPSERIVLISFPNEEAARAWYNSPEYQAAIETADGGLRRRLFAFAGLDGS
jgi:uncharacterized protein (DUF1330 family)